MKNNTNTGNKMKLKSLLESKSYTPKELMAVKKYFQSKIKSLKLKAYDESDPDHNWTDFRRLAKDSSVKVIGFYIYKGWELYGYAEINKVKGTYSLNPDNGRKEVGKIEDIIKKT